MQNRTETLIKNEKDMKKLSNPFQRYMCLSLAMIFSSLTSLSCEKSERHSIYPMEMTFDALEPVSDMRFFIGETEINPQYNEVIVQGFLDRYYTKKTTTGVTSYQSKFIEPEQDSYSNSSFVFNAEDDIRYAADIIETKKWDDVTVMKSKVTNKTEDVPIVKSDLFKYKFDLNANGTYNYHYVVSEKSNESLEVSLLYYKLVRYDNKGIRKELSFGTVHNQFNESFIKTLGERDTLAVKEYRLMYSQK